MFKETGERFVFDSPYDQYGHRTGQEATVLGMVPLDEYDADEVGPMYRIRFDDGSEIEAWPEEVEYDAVDLGGWQHMEDTR